MHRPTLPKTPTAVLALAALAASAASAPSLDALLKKTEQERLADVVSDYWKAVQESKNVHEAFADVQEAVDKQAKRLRDLPDGDLLSAVEDWESILFLATEVDSRGAKLGKVEERVYEDPKMGEYPIAVSTPKKRADTFPIVICIPPKGKSGKEHLAEHWTDLERRETYVLAAPDMPTNDRKWTEIGDASGHGGIDTVLLTLRSVKTTHPIDVDRVFLAGFGEGVDAAVKIAALYPHVFAGVVGRAGDLGEQDPTNLRNVPTFFAGGGEKVSAFAAAAKEMGIENVTASAGATESDVFTWLDAQSRAANPLDVTLAPATGYNNQAYWLKAQGFDPASKPKLRARVDRETNTITVEGEGVTQVTIYFNDAIVDMSKPIKVVCNGQENADVIPRNLKTMLDLAYTSGDPGRVYVNAHTYDLPIVTSK